VFVWGKVVLLLLQAAHMVNDVKDPLM